MNKEEKIVMATGTFDILHPGHGLYLKKAKELGGKNSKLVVVVAKDSTVYKKKRVPIIDENQRLEMIKLLKYVDEAYLGYENNMFKIVHEISPDIIAIGQDQNYDINKLKNDLKSHAINADVIRVQDYKISKLDSSCKIIKKIKDTKFKKNTFEDC
ncbi:adenylyltransferase/cytidyltransferase family protein [Methanobrevibacter filiformis]|uniref:FAD synthase n=1 Tax=Methanobrevibacter filiformis TaxID=55758 RepID=A0A162FE49_9EURY|nr:adenylyltransferase/cytidyltransferase family protein [Methanobrevibacter filiformis]KZX11695.1 bifunctional protein HldE [Methanobrevibacter filiformis]